MCDNGDRSKKIIIDGEPSKFSIRFRFESNSQGGTSVWDYDSILKSDFIGYVIISIEELIEKSGYNEVIPLKPPPLPHNQEAGHLRILRLAFYDPANREGMVMIPQALFHLLTPA